MPPEQAFAMHEGLYRQKLEECILDGKIDEDDATALARIARLLCVQGTRVAEIDAEVKGRVLRTAIQAAMEVGIDQFSKFELDKVLAVKTDLDMESGAAFKVNFSLPQCEMLVTSIR